MFWVEKGDSAKLNNGEEGKEHYPGLLRDPDFSSVLGPSEPQTFTLSSLDLSVLICEWDLCVEKLDAVLTKVSSLLHLFISLPPLTPLHEFKLGP